jgi:glycine/D-amino acid oxidase-like deaminating enzyme
VLEQGDPPHPDASSTDISKLIRMDYADDAFHTDLMARALPGWHAWNDRWERPLYHEVGIAVLTAGPLLGAGFEGRSWQALTARGLSLERLTPGRLPGWRGIADGYINPRAGWAESGAVVAALARWAREAGVQVLRERVDDLDRSRADRVVVAAGAWTPRILPELADRIRPIGQPVFHLRPSDPAAWTPPNFLPFAADIATTGWYGFPLHSGVVKVANHGAGVPTEPDGPREIGLTWEGRLRAWLGEHLPGLAEAPIVGRRLCLYSDSFDGDLWICPHPDRPRVVVASGGSGHAFKFAPALGTIVADVVEGGAPPSRMAWRSLGVPKREAARAG